MAGLKSAVYSVLFAQTLHDVAVKRAVANPGIGSTPSPYPPFPVVPCNSLPEEVVSADHLSLFIRRLDVQN